MTSPSFHLPRVQTRILQKMAYSYRSQNSVIQSRPIINHSKPVKKILSREIFFSILVLLFLLIACSGCLEGGDIEFSKRNNFIGSFLQKNILTSNNIATERSQNIPVSSKRQNPAILTTRPISTNSKRSISLKISSKEDKRSTAQPEATENPNKIRGTENPSCCTPLTVLYSALLSTIVLALGVFSVVQCCDDDCSHCLCYEYSMSVSRTCACENNTSRSSCCSCFDNICGRNCTSSSFNENNIRDSDTSSEDWRNGNNWNGRATIYSPGTWHEYDSEHEFSTTHDSEQTPQFDEVAGELQNLGIAAEQVSQIVTRRTVETNNGGTNAQSTGSADDYLRNCL